MFTKLKIGFILLFLSAFGFSSFTTAQAQTDGTLTFTFTETHQGSTKNVLAVWVTYNSGIFVKTRMRFWGSDTHDHLPSWKSNSGQNVVDAITGPTLTSSTNPTAFGVKTVTWDGKDLSSNTVPDGTYKIFVETSWDNPKPSSNQHSDLISFTFDKSPDTTYYTPAGNSYFSDISIDWLPVAVSGITEASDQVISVYPNPSNGLINIKYDKSIHVAKILVRKLNGQIVYQKALNKSLESGFSIDLQELASGIYFLEVLPYDNLNSVKAKFIITK